MSKYKPGLHKDVSAIFNGVSLPNPVGDAPQQNDITQQSSAIPEPEHHDYSVSKPSVPGQPAQKPTAAQPSVQNPSVSQPPNQKPLVSEPSASQSSVSQLPTQESTAQSNMTPAKPKTQPPPAKSQSKETPAKQPKKADKAAKTKGQAQWQRKLEQIKNKLFTPAPGVSPTKQKVMVIAMPVLFIVLIFLFLRVFSTPSRKVAGPRKPGQTREAVAVSERKVDWKIPKPYPTTLRDPMQFGTAGGVEHAASAGELVVKAIVYSKDNPTAVVGDQVVHEGDRIAEVVITKINDNSVEFEANGKKWMQNVQR